MRRNEIDDELLDASFDFFYWFSRFEFALKESRFLQWDTLGAPAHPSWRKFHQKYARAYVHTQAAQDLLRLHPKQQFVSANDLDWAPVDVSKCGSELCKVVIMLTTVRNNLFHGGKSGDADIDNRSRNLQLLRIGKIVLDELAQLAQLEPDYTRYY